MKNTETTASLGCGYPTIFLVFLILKLTGVVDWSWWWITAPLWMGIALIVSYLLFGVIVAIIVNIISD